VAKGAGDYVYALDQEFGEYQTSATFDNVTSGIHKVYVKDLNGCGIAAQEVAVLGIPKYFTPNQDGYNDTWNVKGVNGFFNAKTIIHIFDRYGKLISQISPTAEGWNGTYNGQQMVASDYWYSIQLEDGRILKGHFALKR
jgi:gliding motility-associated-like protein